MIFSPDTAPGLFFPRSFPPNSNCGDVSFSSVATFDSTSIEPQNPPSVISETQFGLFHPAPFSNNLYGAFSPGSRIFLFLSSFLTSPSSSSLASSLTQPHPLFGGAFSPPSFLTVFFSWSPRPLLVYFFFFPTKAFLFT